jgi:hypothetical protein
MSSTERRADNDIYSGPSCSSIGFGMPYSEETVVTEIKSDFDPFGGEYTQVSFGYRLPVPRPPEMQRMGVPTQIYYKHALHVFIPRDQWVGQYTMWQRVKLVVQDDGRVEVSRIS